MQKSFPWEADSCSLSQDIPPNLTLKMETVYSSETLIRVVSEPRRTTSTYSPLWHPHIFQDISHLSRNPKVLYRVVTTVSCILCFQPALLHSVPVRSILILFSNPCPFSSRYLPFKFSDYSLNAFLTSSMRVTYSAYPIFPWVDYLNICWRLKIINLLVVYICFVL
jgi:hypothetical protein